VVSAEGKGLDWVLEIHVGGDRKRDAELNMARYARLGIPEYFLYDRACNQLAAYRLASPDAAVYTPIVPSHGRHESQVLGLEVQVERDGLRFYTGRTMLLESEEIIARLEAMAEGDRRRAAEEARLRAEAEQRRDEEARLRAEVEREVARLRAELERLR